MHRNNLKILNSPLINISKNFPIIGGGEGGGGSARRTLHDLLFWPKFHNQSRGGKKYEFSSTWNEWFLKFSSIWALRLYIFGFGALVTKFWLRACVWVIESYVWIHIRNTNSISLHNHKCSTDKHAFRDNIIMKQN